MIHRVCATFLVSLLLIATASAQVGWRDEALPSVMVKVVRAALEG